MSLGKVLGSLKKATRKVRTEQEHERVLNKFTASRLYVHSDSTCISFPRSPAPRSLKLLTKTGETTSTSIKSTPYSVYSFYHPVLLTILDIVYALLLFAADVVDELRPQAVLSQTPTGNPKSDQQPVAFGSSYI